MFFTQLEPMKYEHIASGGTQREREGRAELLRPLQGENRDFADLHSIVQAVADGRLTPTEGERAIRRLKACHSCAAVQAVELTAEGLEAAARGLESGCREMERQLRRMSDAMERGCDALERHLNGCI